MTPPDLAVCLCVGFDTSDKILYQNGKGPQFLRPSYGRLGAWQLGGALHLDTVGLHQFAQLAGFMHLADDVATADELAFDVELRDGGPA